MAIEGQVVPELAIPPVDLRRLRESVWRAYVVRGEHAVDAYLREHPTVMAALADAVQPLRSAFGTEAEAILAVASDPEESTPMLFALVGTGREPIEARRILNAFRDSWWPRAPHDVIGHLSFGLEYRHPGDDV